MRKRTHLETFVTLATVRLSTVTTIAMMNKSTSVWTVLILTCRRSHANTSGLTLPGGQFLMSAAVCHCCNTFSDLQPLCF